VKASGSPLLAQVKPLATSVLDGYNVPTPCRWQYDPLCGRMAWDIQANDFNQSIGNPNHGKMDLTNENWDGEFCSINLFPIFWMVVNMPANFDVKKHVESDTNHRRGKRYQQIMGM
jgi:hypothetical protein